MFAAKILSGWCLTVELRMIVDHAKQTDATQPQQIAREKVSFANGTLLSHIAAVSFGVPCVRWLPCLGELCECAAIDTHMCSISFMIRVQCVQCA